MTEDQNNYIVYCHKLFDGRRYIGITHQNANRRWRDGKGYKNNEHFTNAINKYGWDKFEHLILFSNLCEKEAKEKEMMLINEYQTQNKLYGFNLTAGGDGGLNPTDEVRQTMSDKAKRRKPNRKGVALSSETKLKISLANKGKIRTDEFKSKIREANKNNPNSFIKKRRKIKCIETNEIYSSITEASKKLHGKSNANFKRSIENNNKWLGFHWEYV